MDALLDAFARWLLRFGEKMQHWGEQHGGPPVSPTAPTQPGPWDDDDDPFGDPLYWQDERIV